MLIIDKQKEKEWLQKILEPSISKHLGNYFPFANIPICLLLTNAQALSCSHIFCSCFLRALETISRFNLVSSCWKSPNPISRHKRSQSLKPGVVDFWWCLNVRNSLFILFLATSIFYYPLSWVSKTDWMAVKIRILQFALRRKLFTLSSNTIPCNSSHNSMLSA